MKGETLLDGEKGKTPAQNFNDATRRSSYLDVENMARDTDKIAFPGLTTEEVPPRTVNPIRCFVFYPQAG